MIASLQGKLAHKGPDSLVLQVGGVGYEVFLPASRHDRLPAVGEELFLYIQTVVREDSFNLYGFPDSREKRMFQLLLGVSGVGPRLAMNILAAAEPAALSRAIIAGDIVFLKKLPGVGKKTAERLCLELGDKMEFFPTATTDAGTVVGPGAALSPSSAAAADFNEPSFQDAYSALLNLGYPASQARAALEGLRSAADVSLELPVEELLRQALRSLA
ncbi:Holliday junction branch migration protein RuvA [Desulfurivibrio alkaliphilus]|uniref:Holliday junction branch migration complex subunit RuvA n=1 Tax=Desulfurivibrio alkaliphilus (strain DSM 19089 / UNIQEM U267 / AHT2) TaxID=589865 RepID=D6Z2X9_DESAT|nr:Holliday junction branch migration protein RuvA [Desulfurivibrio alkaliphilus]ADH85904.1 Holliday junction DNA helicase RuvA [Desulfurivibrio alkaliphilus AHT 2]